MDLSAKESAQEQYTEAFVAAQADVVAARDANRRMELAVSRRNVRDDAHNGVVQQVPYILVAYTHRFVHRFIGINWNI
jgi:hypothetical protein